MNRVRFIVLITLSCIGLFINQQCWGQDASSVDNNVGDRVDNSIRDTQQETVKRDYEYSEYRILQALNNRYSLLNRGGANGQYSKFQETPPDLFTRSNFFTRYTFNDRESSIGKGTVDTNRADIGVDVATKYGFGFVPYMSFKNGLSSKDGTTVASSNAFAGTLSLSQKLFPLIKDQPNAVYNFEPSTEGDMTKDIYPNFSITSGCDLSYTASRIGTKMPSGYLNTNTDTYDLSPNLSFVLNVTVSFTVSINPTYTLESVSQSKTVDSSSGLLTMQDRNNYTFFTITDKGIVTSQFQAYEFNTLLRDTNNEPALATTPVTYHTWGKFGVGVYYQVTPSLIIRGEYAYEAFQNTYSSHNVTARLDFPF